MCVCMQECSYKACQGLIGVMVFCHDMMKNNVYYMYKCVRYFDVQGNKGGVSIRFDLNGVNVIIVNAHLAAHRHNSAERIEVNLAAKNQ